LSFYIYENWTAEKKAQYTGLSARFVTLGKEFTLTKRREETVCGTAFMPHTLKLATQQGDSKGAH